jgi:GH18 family chitinase
MERSGEYRKFWDKTAQVPFMEKASGTPGVMTYDDPTSIALKWELAQKEGLAGVMFWHIGADQIEGQPILQLKLTSR